MTAVDRAVDLNELERLARAATPGPWFYQPSEDRVPLGMVYGPDGDSFASVAWNPGNDYDQLATAEYLAALWPDVVLALIERVRALEAAFDTLSIKMQMFANARLRDVRDNRDAPDNINEAVAAVVGAWADMARDARDGYDVARRAARIDGGVGQ